MMATLRLFIAIEIPAAIRSQIASAVSELKTSHADIRWEQTEKIHITLKFLGDTKEELFPQIVPLLEGVTAAIACFTIKYSRFGCFPHKREPRIIWIGVEDTNAALTRLAESIERAMETLGFERENKMFHPHVTVGRVRSQRHIKDLLRTMESATFESQPTEVSQIVLIKSELKPSGSEHTRIKAFAFHA